MDSIFFEAVKRWKPETSFPSPDLSQFINSDEPVTDGLLYFIEYIEQTHIPKWIEAFDNWQNWQPEPPQTENDASAEEQEQPQELPQPPSVDGECIVKFSLDALTAWVMVLPPIGDGISVSPAKVQETLQQEGICSGIDSGATVSCCLECFTAFTVAQGRPPEHGTDGSVEELFSREPERTVRVDENDTVDHKDLGWLRTIKAGEVICNVAYATKGVNGETVTGKSIPAKNGTMPPIPAGQNVKFSMDKTQLIAQCEGRLIFSENKFSVETTLVIHGNVDGNVGNIVMPGNIVIKGSVMSGFTIYAKGNISISGVIENAYVCALGDVEIKTGVKGDGNAVVESSKNISCKFVENATLRAKGNITAEYIVNSNISSLGDIFVTHGKGTLIGGTVRVGRKISAKIIGNSANRPLTITMGMDPEILQELQHHNKELKALESKLAETNKNITFLEDQPSLDDQYKKLLQQLKFQKTIDTMHVNKLQKAIDKLEESFSPEACEIETKTFYPPATIQIGSHIYQSTKVWQMHRVVFRDKEITFVPF